jgi:hypothetical protein
VVKIGHGHRLVRKGGSFAGKSLKPYRVSLLAL